MARIRTIKPSFFTSLTIANLTLEQRLTFIGLWTHVDDAGRCDYDARLIKAALWPLDDRSSRDVETDIRALTEASLITHYKAGNRRYLQVNGWVEHQKINRPTPSTLPPIEEGEIWPFSNENSASRMAHEGLSEDSLGERKGRERKGKDSATRGEPDGTPRTPDAVTSQALIGEWLDTLTERPPGSIISQIAKHTKIMLNEGVHPDRIRAGIAEWQRKGLHPSTLPSVVHEVSTPRTQPSRPNRVQQNLAVVARIAEREQAQARLEIAP